MREPTNITIELFKGDPTKGHEGWCMVIQFTDMDTGERVVLKGRKPVAGGNINTALSLASNLLHEEFRKRQETSG